MFKKSSIETRVIVFILAMTIPQLIINGGFNNFPIVSVTISVAVCVPLSYLLEHTFSKLVKRLR